MSGKTTTETSGKQRIFTRKLIIHARNQMRLRSYTVALIIMLLQSTLLGQMHSTDMEVTIRAEDHVRFPSCQPRNEIWKSLSDSSVIDLTWPIFIVWICSKGMLISLCLEPNEKHKTQFSQSTGEYSAVCQNENNTWEFIFLDVTRWQNADEKQVIFIW